MSAGNVHLIVTCTRRKTVAAGDAVFPDERDVERAYGLWLVLVFWSTLLKKRTETMFSIF